MYLFKCLLILIITITFTVKECLTLGSIELNLLSFHNEEGRLDDGTCCSDGTYQHKCTGPCKTFFRVCLKQFESKININSTCTFGEIITPVLGNNSVNLDNQSNLIPGFKNPIRFPFNFSWPGMFTIIVEAWHETYYSSSAINQLSKKLIIRYSASRVQKVNPIPTEKYQRSNYTELSYSYRVICDQNYYGEQCSTLCKPRDDSFGHYTCASATGERECLKGWTGKFCTEPVCSEGCSKEHGYCSRPDECKCKYGWSGKNCTQCERYPGCVNGECGQPWECKCKSGWGGLLCNQDLNYCGHHNPCKNDGVCSNTGTGSYNCNCPSNFIGKNCEIEISRCELNPCKNNGVCKTLNGNLQNYTCICSNGYHGKHCEIQLGTCANKPCRNSASCVDGPSGPVCVCKPGYYGEHCENKYDSCSPSPCRNGGHCNPTNNNNSSQAFASNSSYTCTCLNGFVGPHCEIISQCALNPCSNGGQCIDTATGYKCICSAGFTSKDCSININDCESSPCLNGGQCIDKVNDFECACKANYFGTLCEHYKLSSLGEQKTLSSKLTSRLIESTTIKDSSKPVIVKVYNTGVPASSSILNHQLPLATLESRPSAERLNSEQLIIISIISLIVPLSALLIYLFLRYVKKRNSLANNNNGLPCKSINEIEVMRQNEANSNLLNNSSQLNNNNKLSTKLSNAAPGANVIVNSLNKASSVYSLNKAKSTAKLNNQLNNENIYTSYPINYTTQLRQQHNLYSTINNNRHSMYGMIDYNKQQIYSSDLNSNLKQQSLYATMKKSQQYNNQINNQMNNQLNNNQKSIYESVQYATYGQMKPNDIYSSGKAIVYNLPNKQDKY